MSDKQKQCDAVTWPLPPWVSPGQGWTRSALGLCSCRCCRILLPCCRKSSSCGWARCRPSGTQPLWGRTTTFSLLDVHEAPPRLGRDNTFFTSAASSHLQRLWAAPRSSAAPGLPTWTELGTLSAFLHRLDLDAQTHTATGFKLFR